MKIEEVPVPRKSTSLERTKTPPKKRVKKTTSGPRKKRRTLQISSSEEIGDRPTKPADQEAKTLARQKSWKPKVENLNMQIINDNSFLQLNKYYDLYNNLDRR